MKVRKKIRKRHKGSKGLIKSVNRALGKIKRSISGTGIAWPKW